MMKMRTMNPAVTMISGTISQYATDKLQYIKAQSAAYGTSVLSNCQTLRPRAGVWYLATTAFQSVAGAVNSVVSFIIV